MTQQEILDQMGLFQTQRERFMQLMQIARENGDTIHWDIWRRFAQASHEASFDLGDLLPESDAPQLDAASFTDAERDEAEALDCFWLFYVSQCRQLGVTPTGAGLAQMAEEFDPADYIPADEL